MIICFKIIFSFKNEFLNFSETKKFNTENFLTFRELQPLVSYKRVSYKKKDTCTQIWNLWFWNSQHFIFEQFEIISDIYNYYSQSFTGNNISYYVKLCIRVTCPLPIKLRLQKLFKWSWTQSFNYILVICEFALKFKVLYIWATPEYTKQFLK